MPGGTIGYLSQASSGVGGSGESSFNSTGVDPALLVNGTNVIAVEVHQSQPNSSDISFDLRLISGSSNSKRIEVIRNTDGSNAFAEGVVWRDTSADLFAGFDVAGYYTDENLLGDGNTNGLWSSPHSSSFGAYQARNSVTAAVLPP